MTQETSGPSIYKAQENIDMGWSEDVLLLIAKDIQTMYGYCSAEVGSRRYADWPDDYKDKLKVMIDTLKSDYMILREHIQKIRKEKTPA